MINTIIFDLDGVLVDANQLHFEALNRSLSKFGFIISKEEHQTIFDGLPTTKKLHMLTKLKGLPEKNYDAIWKEKQSMTREIIDKEFSYDERMRGILKQLKFDGFSLAVCTNSIRETAKMMLIRKGLLEFIEFFISNQDVRLSKPNPEIFLRAMIKLGVGPHKCLIIEDSYYGCQAALNSGAYLLKVENAADVNYEKIIESIECNQNGRSELQMPI